MNTNVVVLTGRCVRPAELKYTTGGLPICTFSIAVNERSKNDGEYYDRPNYFDITVFGNYGKTMQPYLTKGREVTVTGRLHQDRWESDGQKYSRINIIAENLELQREPKGNGAIQPEEQPPFEPPANPEEIPSGTVF